MRSLPLLAALLLAPAASGAAGLSVEDDLGNRVELERPARRIVSLAPHATELLFAAGAGERVVGAVEYSDYPPAAREVPHIGSYSALDMERILTLRPDLVVAWQSGNGPQALAQLRGLGLPLYISEPRRLEDIPASVERLGRLAGSSAVATSNSQQFRERLQQLKAKYSHKKAVTVFYEVWNQPLMSVNGEHLISHILRLCGGRNVFADLPALAPVLEVEAVLAADPEAIIASGMGEERPEWLDDWQRWPQLRAVREGKLYFVPPDLLQRPTPRTLDGAERICQALEQARWH